MTKPHRGVPVALLALALGFPVRAHAQAAPEAAPAASPNAAHPPTQSDASPEPVCQANRHPASETCGACLERCCAVDIATCRDDAACASYLACTSTCAGGAPCDAHCGALPDTSDVSACGEWSCEHACGKIGMGREMEEADAKQQKEERDQDDRMIVGYVSPGIVWSTHSGGRTGHGSGFELSAGYQPRLRPSSFLVLGGVYRSQHYGGTDWRYTAAGQVSARGFGIELGWAKRDDAPNAPAVSGLHVAPFLSLGVLYAGMQLLVPMNRAARTEIDVNVGLKFPLPQLFMPFAIANAIPHCC